jgi:hypothetical protein
MQVMAALSRDDNRACVGASPRSSALVRSTAKCVRAHDLHTPTLQSIDVARESLRSIIGAMHNRCDKLFIYLRILALSRSNK